MPAEPVTGAEREPRRARYVIPKDMPRRAELLAAAGVALVLLHLIFAQLTLVLALIFYGVTRVTRWRPSWLAAPAAVGLAWTLAIGPAAAGAGFAAGPARVVSYLGGIAGHSSRLLHLGVAYSGMGHWLLRQLPLALIAASAEAALAAWLDWLHTDEWDVRSPRRGLLGAVRRAAVIRTVRSGGVLTRDGVCLGVDEMSGGRAALSWPEIAGGVLVAGASRSGTTISSFQLVHAAIRLRKPVIIVNLGGGTDLGPPLSAVCAAASAPFYEFSAAGPASYEPFRYGDPARRATLVTAMINWSGTADHYRRSFAAYLTDVFELIDAAPADPRVPMLDDVAHLLDLAALRARLEQVPAYHPRRPALADRIQVSVGQAHADPELLTTVATQLAELRTSPIGRWLRAAGPAHRAHIDIGRVVRDRAVALFSLSASGNAGAAARMAWLIGQDILAADADLAEIGISGDGVAWFDHCEGLPQPMVRDLIGRGSGAGLPVLLTTTSSRAGLGLAGEVNALLLHRMPDAASAESFAALTGQKLVPEPYLARPAAGGRAQGGTGTGTGAGTSGGDGRTARREVAALAARAATVAADGLTFTARPLVPPGALQHLGLGEFSLVVRQPERRLVAAARTVPARLPDTVPPRPPGAAVAPSAIGPTAATEMT